MTAPPDKDSRPAGDQAAFDEVDAPSVPRRSFLASVGEYLGAKQAAGPAPQPPPGDTAYRRLLDALRVAGRQVTDHGDRATAQCPAHDDHRPSLALRQVDGSVLIHCHAGCETASVVAALGLGLADLYDSPRGATYIYPDGRIVRRTAAKRFWQEGNTKGRSLFRADRIGDATTVYICEGEKDCLAVESVGGTAVCSAMGAGKAYLADWSPLAGKHVIIVADRDDPGRKHAAQVVDILRGTAASVRITEPAVGKDAADHIAAGHGLDKLADVTPPEPETVNGAALLDDAESFIRRFCVLPGDHCYVAVTLWAAHTHFIDRMETTPRLACLSPEPGSGKTRVLEVLDLLCRNPLLALDISMAAFYRIVEERQPAVLLDEVDAIFAGKKHSESSEDMRRVINNGYRVGAVVQRCGGKNRDEVHEFHVFAPVAMAGLGNLPDTLATRSIILPMKRRRPSERVEQFRDRIHRPEGQTLQMRIAAWAADVTDLSYPDLPDGVADRDADVWEPLVMVADAAGGDWPARARSACLRFIADKPESAISLGVRLLGDLRRIWPDAAAVMPTVEIITALAGLEEAPWADLYGDGLKPRKLAQLLSDYGIKSQDVWTPAGARKGYRREDMWDAWRRYLPPETGDVGDVGDVGDEKPQDIADLADIADSEGDGELEADALFGRSATNGQPRTCTAPGCSNRLIAPEARAASKCRPCRDEAMAGYDA
ncbi:DUF3631 domain-containing protein [Mycobacterium canetti]|uniref:DUF3631 domain-containing protein n=1 Tax=Mycobacterium canetti TaxID=78331 RepID=UPI0002A578E1|nr:DUF3631 domain-containing protein [Mycobacterium canetti]CCK59356.1 Conserved PhiRv2-like prophage protein of unknown function (modular protein) [Mycobacterium canettii CIPT 140070010]